MTNEATQVEEMAKNLSVEPILSSHDVSSLICREPEMMELVARQGKSVCLLVDGTVLTSDIHSPGTHSVISAAKIMGYTPVVRPALGRIVRSLIDDHGRINPESAATNDTIVEKLKSDLLSVAVSKGATDIHIRIREGEMALLRFRIDGEMQNYDELTYDDACSLGQLLFITLSSKGVGFSTNSHLEGNIIEEVGNKRIPIRLTSVPEARGAIILLRLDLVGNKSLSLRELGVSKASIEELERGVNVPHGLILLTGPVGAGKSTLLRALVREMPESLAIWFLEDPVEDMLDNAEHVQIDERVPGHAMADMQKSVTRMDGDVNILGEIRDTLSASTAQGLVQIGRRVLATLHATRVQAIPRRLVSLGLTREMLGEPDFLRALVNQRLLPLLCDKCALSMKEADKKDLARWKIVLGSKASKARIKNPAGCKSCKHTGVAGRVLVTEILVPTAEDRRFITSGDAPGWEESLKERNWEGLEIPTWNLVAEGRVSPATAEQLVGLGEQA